MFTSFTCQSSSPQLRLLHTALIKNDKNTVRPRISNFFILATHKMPVAHHVQRENTSGAGNTARLRQANTGQQRHYKE